MPIVHLVRGSYPSGKTAGPPLLRCGRKHKMKFEIKHKNTGAILVPLEAADLRGVDSKVTENSVFHEAYNPLSGRQFRSQSHTCVWTVLRYYRGGNWVCEEPDHHTTCHFQESEIAAGLIEKEGA